jgi:hypothetical protein
MNTQKRMHASMLEIQSLFSDLLTYFDDLKLTEAVFPSWIRGHTTTTFELDFSLRMQFLYARL